MESSLIIVTKCACMPLILIMKRTQIKNPIHHCTSHWGLSCCGSRLCSASCGGTWGSLGMQSGPPTSLVEVHVRRCPSPSPPCMCTCLQNADVHSPGQCPWSPGRTMLPGPSSRAHRHCLGDIALPNIDVNVQIHICHTQKCHGYGGVVSCIHEQHGPSIIDIPMASSGVSWRSARYCTRSAFRLPVIAVALCVPVLFRMDSRGISVVLMSSPDYGTVTMPPAVQTPNHGPKGVC